MNNTKSILKEQAAYIENNLANFLNKDMPNKLSSAMEYSLMAGGKRLRPILCLSVANLFGVAKDDVLNFACAIEMIHTYSLIHDDLPSMDNDDLRRGKPTCHKAFDEATAILAGDALLTDAFALMMQTNLASERVLKASLEMANASGSAGMVGGQILDMEFTAKNDVNIDMLKSMHSLKTGALIKASCVSGGILAGASEQDLKKIDDYGVYLGLAFQIIDDILDVIGDTKTLGKPVGSDAQNGKMTYPNIVGIDKSYELARHASQQALEALDGFEHEEADFLRGIVNIMLERVI